MNTTEKAATDSGKQEANSGAAHDLYAVFESGGRQHIARLGAKLKLDRLTAEVGAKMVFDKVLLLSDKGKLQLGSPYVEGQKVEVKVINHGRSDKIRVIKFKRRKHHLKRGTARHNYTEVEINAIGGTKLQAQPAAKPMAKSDAKPEPKKEAKAAAAVEPAAKADAKPATDAKTEPKKAAKE